MEREFPQGAAELEVEGVNRRHFLKIMAASFGLAGLGLTGCRQPEHKILPYVKQPENVIPGVAQYYSTSRPTAWGNVPLVVETHQAPADENRRQPELHAERWRHRRFASGECARFVRSGPRQAQPQWWANPGPRGGARPPGRMVGESLASTQGKGFAVLAEKSTSPSRRKLVKELTDKYPDLIWAEYEPLDYGAAERAAVDYWGQPVRIRNRFADARRILSVDSDFLGREPGETANVRAFSRSRRVDDPAEAESMNRLYAVEGDLSLTGAMADHRLRLENRRMEALLVALAVELLKLGADGDTNLAGAVQSLPVDSSLPLDWISACARDLYEHKGEALVVVGPALSEKVQWLGFFVNELLDAPGKTQELLALPENPAASIGYLAKSLRSGNVDTLFILGGNPAFDAPADLDWPLMQTRAKEVVRFGYWEDETSASASTNILQSHYLESWEDGETRDGTYVAVQPMIEPLLESFSTLEFLAGLSGREQRDPYEIVKQTFAERSGASDTDNAFNTFLAVGVLPESGYKIAEVGANSSAIGRRIQEEWSDSGVPSFEDLEVQFRPSYHVYDGRFANNGWMMECPDPITKLTWDNAILISPRMGKQLEEKSGIAIFPTETLMNETGQLQQNTARFSGAKSKHRSQTHGKRGQLTGTDPCSPRSCGCGGDPARSASVAMWSGRWEPVRASTSTRPSIRETAGTRRAPP